MAKNRMTNTQASMFTAIPAEIVKSWTPKIYDIERNVPVDRPASHHESSLINRIELVVRFQDLQDDSGRNDDEDDDYAHDRAIAWTEARKDWCCLENAIETAIAQFADRMIERSKEKDNRTGEILAKRKTSMRAHKLRAKQHEELRIPYQDGESVVSRATSKYDDNMSNAPTVRPGDSASVISIPRPPPKRSAPMRAMSFMDFVRT